MKITLTDLVNLQNETTAVNAINANNSIIETEFDNTLSRDGTGPNQMLATLDMNSNQIINLPSPATGLSPLRLVDFSTLANISGAIAGTNISIAGPTISTIPNPNFVTSVTTPFLNVNLNGVPNSISGDNFVGSSQLGKLFHGNVGTPVTVGTPSIGISRYEQLTAGQDTSGGQSAGLYVTTIGNNLSDDITYTGQVNGITAKATQIGWGDVCGVYAVADHQGTHVRASYGVFSLAVNNKVAASAYSVNPVVCNNTGVEQPFVSSSSNASIGILNQALGVLPSHKLCTAGVANINTGVQFSAGYANLNNAVRDYGFIDESGSKNSFYVDGSHESGLNLTNGTFSTYSIQAPGFLVSGASGNTAISGVLQVCSTVSPPGGGSTGLGIAIGNQQGVYFGNGIPSLSAGIGSLYLRNDGSSTSTRLYVNTNGSTGWTNVVTAA